MQKCGNELYNLHLVSSVYCPIDSCIVSSSETLARGGNLGLRRIPCTEIFSTLLDTVDHNLAKCGMILESGLTGQIMLTLFHPQRINIPQAPVLFPFHSNLNSLEMCHFFKIVDPILIMKLLNHILPPHLQVSSVGGLLQNLSSVVCRHRRISEVNFFLPTSHNARVVKFFQITENTFLPGSDRAIFDYSSWCKSITSDGHQCNYSALSIESPDTATSHCQLLAGFIKKLGLNVLINCSFCTLANIVPEYTAHLTKSVYSRETEPFENGFCYIASPQPAEQIVLCNTIKIPCRCKNTNRFNVVFVRQTLPRQNAPEQICNLADCVRIGKEQGAIIEQVLDKAKRTGAIPSGEGGFLENTPP